MILIILLGLTLRTGFFLNSMRDFWLVGDARNYHIMSHQIVDDGIYGYGIGQKTGFPNAYVTPVYPLFLSSIYYVFHDPFLQITLTRIAQVIIGGLFTPLIAFLLVRRISGKDSVALITAFFLNIYPTYIMAPVLLLTEVLAMASMLLYFYVATVALQKKRLFLNILAGLLFAVQILIRPAMLPLFILPLIFCFFTSYRDSRLLLFKLFAFQLLGFVILMLPWWVRNYVVLHKIILTSTGSGDPLLAGSYPDMKDLFADYLEIRKTRPISQAAYAKERIINKFLTEPITYLKWYTIGKIHYMLKYPWLLYHNQYHPFIHLTLHRIILLFGSVGILVNSVRSQAHRFINIYFALFLGIYLVFIPVDRYMYQHMFFLMFAAAYFIAVTGEALIRSAVAKLSHRS